MLTRIRNAIHAKHAQCDIPASKVKEQIAKAVSYTPLTLPTKA